VTAEEAQTIDALIVLEEFCKELAAITLAKFHLVSWHNENLPTSDFWIENSIYLFMNLVLHKLFQKATEQILVLILKD